MVENDLAQTAAPVKPSDENLRLYYCLLDAYAWIVSLANKFNVQDNWTITLTCPDGTERVSVLADISQKLLENMDLALLKRIIN